MKIGRMRQKEMSRVSLIILFTLYALLSAGGLVLFKLGGQDASIQFQHTGFSLSLSWKMMIGVVCYLCSFLLWLFIVSKTQLTFAMPLSVGIVNILVFLGSSRFLGEQITPVKIIGLIVIIAGLFLISIGER